MSTRRRRGRVCWSCNAKHCLPYCEHCLEDLNRHYMNIRVMQNGPNQKIQVMMWDTYTNSFFGYNGK